ncbi:MAG: hypothetical protein EAZ14_11540 [Runella slithyformis]|jgi:hypothetical protein|nr:MAG: hypothetical protein EAY79_07180 [Runella slithyformis]TAF30944.1 MAG: hypothetical protein EAZ67_13540 [Cytophagales bacterium]TAF96831.1 MAG: hypothetical protein EAZ46_04100 [Runella sp.]TAG39843.1 MAG: hypothetical protein EAZ32_08685 [Cytophagia bacterium]TAF48697.1 MAG: hypothetical protein EAZ63_03880 [Runella slithyformis]
MNTTELIHQQVDFLPQDAHLALLEYIDFLVHKYQKKPEAVSQSEALIQELVTKRYQNYQLNQQQNSEPIRETVQRLKQKYGWNE